ncbi:MAG: FAD-dependent oxidoreductase [Eggerthellaceae bacterium]|nr:FAD-dependent oxidoreductase [Eggerthellaceae bacterium]
MQEQSRYDVVIIGAGVVGCAIARELTRWNASVCVVDRASDVAALTTRANSGIVHAGFDAKHGSLKARYNVEGSKMYAALSEELGFAYRNNGSLVLAFTAEERDSVQALLENGKANGVDQLRIVDAAELQKLEPNVSHEALCALYAPTGAICNPYETALAFAENALANGAQVRLNTEVQSIARVADGSGFELGVRDVLNDAEKTIAARVVVNAAGVNADRIGALAGCELPEITARRGEYVILDKRRGDAFNATMFRAPSKVGKGVLVSPTVDGNLIVGPNAHAVERTARDTTGEGIAEVLKKAHDLWPELDESAVIARFAGLRATPANGDFTVGEADGLPGFFNAAGIESPGLTAAPAIAVDLASQIAERLGAEANPAFNPHRDETPRYADMTEEERAARVKEDPAWGRMICRCEQVTEAEIRAAVNAPIPACTLDSVKWRTRAGMGRCHGGFCSPYVTQIIAQETGCAIDEVRKGDVGTRVAAEHGAVKNGPLGGAAPTAHAEQVETVTASYDVLVAGGGAGGIAAALAAREGGAQRVVIIDREDDLGGILKQCIHPGFGLDRYNEELTGPEYAARDEADLAASGIDVLKRTTVSGFEPADGGYRVEAIGPEGAYSLQAKSVVLATGSRERSAGQVDLNGDRPAGVYTAGSAQNFMNLMGVLPGREVVIYGSGDIGLIMARRLAWEGAHVKAVVERAKRPKGLRRNVKQCLEDNDIPILLSQSVVRVFGKERVEGVEIVHTDRETKKPIPGTEYRMDCDTLLLSCGLIPEQDLLAEAGGAPVLRGSCETTLPGVFLCGNASQIHDIVDAVTEEGVYVGACAAAYVTGQPAPDPIERADEGAAAVATAAIFDSLPEGTEQITCICCPKGCEMLVSDAASAPADLTDKERKFHIIGDYYVENNICKRGLNYALEEKTAPQRTLTSIVRAANRLEPVSVRTDRPIAKSSIPACLEVLRDVEVDGAFDVGHVIVEDICGTGANIVATKPLR